ncbi:SLC13 family permease [Leifsonia sp. Root112D2]|uniref:SLC13 family permease n=1 Tax=Leifsonia sp. Root112D2 TaxID=1736426 RepID=UPI0006F3A0B9|nr:SLC13 family permease [Leifsonia sp. Root112D2]KQV08500.1 arsenic transporter [Leifsonia sp. Root112D2]
MRTAVIGCVLLALGAASVAVGILPLADALELWGRIWPVLLFVLAITVVTELAAEAGLFRFIAERTARWGRGRAWLLWLLVVAFATLSTIFLSLDTTAVLLTPVVIVLARHAGLNPLPFALTTVWLANTASMLLPVSNLTNLLAQHQLGGLSPLGFAAMTWAPALVCVVVPAAAIFLVARRSLLLRYEPDASAPVTDRPLFACSAIVVALLLPALVSGVAVWIPAVCAALILAAVFAVRRREVLRASLVPFSLLVLASGLLFVMAAAHALGLGTALAAVSGTGESPRELLRLAGVGAFGANAINNLPAYLALEPVAGSPLRLIALLIGVNAGPLITPWASLATLLWHRRLTAMGVALSWRRYALLGVVVAPATVALAVLALVLVTHGAS